MLKGTAMHEPTRHSQSAAVAKQLVSNVFAPLLMSYVSNSLALAACFDQSNIVIM